MRAFLRLFDEFRGLEAQVAELTGQCARQQAAYERLQSECEKLLTKKQDLQTDLTFSRAAHSEASTDKLLLQDRLEAALADKDHLWDVMKRSLESERNALRMQVNHAVQKAGGGIPYPDAHSLSAASVRPVQEPGAVGRKGRLLPSESLARHNQSFMQELVTLMDPVKE